MNKKVVCPFPEGPHSCTIQCVLGRIWAAFRLKMTKKDVRPFLERPTRVLYNVFFSGSRDWAVLCLEMNQKGGLPVPGEAPFVYYIMLFGARLGCIPSGDE